MEEADCGDPASHTVRLNGLCYREGVDPNSGGCFDYEVVGTDVSRRFDGASFVVVVVWVMC